MNAIKQLASLVIILLLGFACQQKFHDEKPLFEFNTKGLSEYKGKLSKGSSRPYTWWKLPVNEQGIYTEK